VLAAAAAVHDTAMAVEILRAGMDLPVRDAAGAGWTGPAATAFAASWSGDRESLNEAAGALRQAGWALRQLRQALQAAQDAYRGAVLRAGLDGVELDLDGKVAPPPNPDPAWIATAAMAELGMAGAAKDAAAANLATAAVYWLDHVIRHRRRRS